MWTRTPKRQTWLWAFSALLVAAYSCNGRTNDGAVDLGPGGEGGMTPEPSSGGDASSGGGGSPSSGGLGGGTPTCDPATTALGSDGECHPRAFEFTSGFALSGAVLDSEDAVILRGWSSISGWPDGPGFVQKLGPTGELVWRKELERGALDLAIDAEDHLYLSSVDMLGQGGSGPVGAIEKLSPNGESVWREPIGQIDDHQELLLTVGGDGTLYVAGTTNVDLFAPSAGESDVFVARYDLDGDRLWGVQLGGSDSNSPEDLLVSSDGEVILGTTTWISSSTLEHVVRGLSPVDGSESWTLQLEARLGFRLALDSADNLLVSTTGLDPNGYEYQAVLTKYDSAHEVAWSYQSTAGYDPTGEEVISGAGDVITWAVQGNDPEFAEEFILRLTPDGQKSLGPSLPDDLSIEFLATRGDVWVVGGIADADYLGWLRKYVER